MQYKGPTMVWIVKYIFLSTNRCLALRKNEQCSVCSSSITMSLSFSKVCLCFKELSCRYILKNYSGFTEVRWMYLYVAHNSENTHTDSLFLIASYDLQLSLVVRVGKCRDCHSSKTYICGLLIFKGCNLVILLLLHLFLNLHIISLHVWLESIVIWGM